MNEQMYAHDLNYDAYYLEHHGIKGQKWGVRRFQNYDGTLTNKGKKHKSETDEKRKGLSDKQKEALKIGAITFGALAGTALVAVGAKYAIEKSNANLTKEMINHYSKLAKEASEQFDKYDYMRNDYESKVNSSKRFANMYDTAVNNWGMKSYSDDLKKANDELKINSEALNKYRGLSSSAKDNYRYYRELANKGIWNSYTKRDRKNYKIDKKLGLKFVANDPSNKSGLFKKK